MPRLRLILLSVLAACVLAACETSEERAERHYQSALSYMDAGEVELALVDLRRVFDYNGVHKEARALYAGTIRDLGRFEEAYGQYLRLVEQYPDEIEGRRALAEMAFARNDWTELERHGRAAIDLAPELPAVQAIAAALDYRDAALAEDREALARAADEIRGVLDAAPDNAIARRLLIAHLLGGETPQAALPEIDRALENDPDNVQLHEARLNLMANARDQVGYEAQLVDMFNRFPDHVGVRDELIRWYIQLDDLVSAERILRQIAARSPDEADGFLVVVQFLIRSQGVDAGLAELDALVAAADGPPLEQIYRISRAELLFESGERDVAVSQMRDLITTTEPSDVLEGAKVVLARMLVQTGAEADARGLVEEIVAGEATNLNALVDALMMRARWAIDDDRSGDAVLDLRAALGQDPRNPTLLTLMATALELEGSRELAGERLALAVEASENAVRESLLYARFLTGEGRLAPAQQVLTDALRANPGNLDVIAAAADLARAQENWIEVEALRAQLNGREDPQARALAEYIDTGLLLGRDGFDEISATLRAQMESDDPSEARRAVGLLALATARNGDLEAGRALIADAIAKSPDDTDMRLLEVTLDFAAGDGEKAEATLRDIIAAFPGAERPINQLRSYLIAVGRTEEADTLIATELERAPTSRYLRLIQGAIFGTSGAIDDAIEIFEGLYEENARDVIVANNLASLLATYRSDDPEALTRAEAVSRRLRNSDVPAFQDTYGWVAFLRGNVEEALVYLEPAAAGLPQDAIVQYHLGRVYEALDRPDDARAQYTRALDLSEGTDIASLEQFTIARSRLAELPATTGQ